MDWNCNPRPFGFRPQSSFGFLYSCNNDHYAYPPGAGEMKHEMMQTTLPVMESSCNIYENSIGTQEKKKRLTSDQLESLENSFQEEIKLDPDRKMKLAHELGLQPRQIAVWFQNRRARWKAKQLERLYDALKQEYDTVSREKQKLQDEVLELRSMLKEQGNKRQAMASTTGHTEISGEETVESTSVEAIRSSNNHHHPHQSATLAAQHQVVVATAAAAAAVDGNYVLNYNPTMPATSYAGWAVYPSYP